VEGLDGSGSPVQTKVQARDLPRLQMIVRAQPPGILRGSRQDVNEPVTLECKPHNEQALAALRERLGWSKLTVTSPPVRPRTFLRVLAKIAHSFACAESGFGAFQPTLLPLILGEPVSDTFYVGGYEPAQAQEQAAVTLKMCTHNGRELLVAGISLRFFPSLPKYQVICGVAA